MNSMVGETSKKKIYDMLENLKYFEIVELYRSLNPVDEIIYVMCTAKMKKVNQ